MGIAFWEYPAHFSSPPSRAAWIEILHVTHHSAAVTSRRLHGRRGLKYIIVKKIIAPSWSPPSRAAWIEIGCKLILPPKSIVAAFTGGVD